MGGGDFLWGQTDRSKLQDSVPASPYEEVDQTVRQELGQPLSELFASIEQEALASASVAQVHRCQLKDGRQAVVKVGEGVGVGGERGWRRLVECKFSGRAWNQGA